MRDWKEKREGRGGFSRGAQNSAGAAVSSPSPFFFFSFLFRSSPFLFLLLFLLPSLLFPFLLFLFFSPPPSFPSSLFPLLCATLLCQPWQQHRLVSTSKVFIDSGAVSQCALLLWWWCLLPGGWTLCALLLLLLRCLRCLCGFLCLFSRAVGLPRLHRNHPRDTFGSPMGSMLPAPLRLPGVQQHEPENLFCDPCLQGETLVNFKILTFWKISP